MGYGESAVRTVELGNEVGKMEGADEGEVARIRGEEELLLVVGCWGSPMLVGAPGENCCSTDIQGWLMSASLAGPLLPPLTALLVRLDMVPGPCSVKALKRSCVNGVRMRSILKRVVICNFARGKWKRLDEGQWTSRQTNKPVKLSNSKWPGLWST